MKKTKLKFLVGGAIVVIIGLAGWYLNKPEKVSAAMTQFAQCLRDKQITMYGAYWCSHCQNEKKAFGEAFQYVPYVECTEEPGKCTAAGVQYFPTWIFPASPARLVSESERAGGPGGQKFVGEQGIEKLSVESGCPFPKEE